MFYQVTALKRKVQSWGFRLMATINGRTVITEMKEIGKRLELATKTTSMTTAMAFDANMLTRTMTKRSKKVVLEEAKSITHMMRTMTNDTLTASRKEMVLSGKKSNGTNGMVNMI